MIEKSKKIEVVAKKENEKQEEKEFIAPDGGWGWMIVAGFGLNNFFVIPIINSYGLIFIDRFNELGFDSTDVTFLMSLNSWFGMILGIFNGPLLKKFGYRKMSFVGITLFLIGFFFTGIATKYIHFVICYGLINSVGYVLLMSAFNLALHSYFKVKRSHAAGTIAFLTAIGPIVIPILISLLLQTYGIKWTVFILSAITLNAYAGACLLQPIKWHAKKPNAEEVKIVDEEGRKIQETITLIGSESPVTGSQTSLSQRPTRKWCSQDIAAESEHLTFFEIRKSESEDVQRKDSIIELADECHNNIMKSVVDLTHADEDEMSLRSMERLNKIASDDEKEESSENKSWILKLWEYVKNLYDLDLLADPIYLNIMAGISIASIGELMFSLLTPFILNELGLDLDQKAYFMSTVAFSDTISRLVTPYIGDRIKLKSRAMYCTALFFLFITRSFMFIPTSYEGFLVVAVGLGLGKGVRTVYWAIVIPDYVPIKKLPSAAAIQSLVNGVLLALSGYIIGVVISASGSYTNAIIACNILTITTVIMWYTEFGIFWYKNKIKRKVNGVALEKEENDLKMGIINSG